MKTPRYSSDGRCPGCSGTDWKLAEVIFKEGWSVVDTESDGGGFGGGIGGGDGQRGVILVYQGIKFETRGSQTTALALDNAPPSEPESYREKADLLSSCDEHQRGVEAERRRIDLFAVEGNQVTPGLIFDKSSCDRELNWHIAKVQQTCKRLEVIHEHEKELALWRKSRVCTRCGEAYLVESLDDVAKASFEIPALRMPNQQDRCPACGTYQWKSASVYYQLMVAKQDYECTHAESQLKRAEEIAAAPRPGFWGRIKQKLEFLPPMEESRGNLAFARYKLDDVEKTRDALEQRYPGLEGVRVCSACEVIYTLSSGGSVRA